EDQVERRLGRPRRRYHGQHGECERDDQPWNRTHAIAPPRLSTDARRLVHVGVLPKVRPDLAGEELHPLERPFVAPAVQSQAEDSGPELVREDPELASTGRGPAGRRGPYPGGAHETE